MAASSPLGLLRPKPFRGDVIAAGVVVLTTLVWLVRVRFGAAWGDGAQLAWAAVPCAFVTLVALLAEPEGEAPRAYQSVLYIAAVALFLAVVVSLGDVLGVGVSVRSAVARATAIEAGLVALFALGFAIGRNSAACTLLGSLFGGAAVLALIDWAFSPGVGALRWELVGLMVVYGFGAIGQRDRHLRHGVALIDAAGTAVLLIGLTFLLSTLVSRAADGLLGGGDFGTAPAYGATLSTSVSDHSVGWGWELLIVAVGFGLIAYSSVDRQPGPAYLGVLNLIVFALITSFGVSAHGATLVGWPIALAIAALALLAIGLRPTTPAPPPPDVDAPEPPPLPLRGV
jgi:hypothetical protein